MKNGKNYSLGSLYVHFISNPLFNLSLFIFLPIECCNLLIHNNRDGEHISFYTMEQIFDIIDYHYHKDVPKESNQSFMCKKIGSLYDCRSSCFLYFVYKSLIQKQNPNPFSQRIKFGLCCLGDPCGNRTHVNGVRGRCLNRLTNGP